jgi:membrane carboxypeptidase/penicillin-binding protein
MLRDVVLHGTGVAATRLKYPVAGKTGTTNDFTDAWFIGFSPDITCGVWVGFDEKRTLGNKETGARAALPIWIDFMETALPRVGPPHDFLAIPDTSNLMFARQAAGLPIGHEPRNRSLQATGEPRHHGLLEPASKRDVEQSNSTSPGHQEQ